MPEPTALCRTRLLSPPSTDRGTTITIEGGALALKEWARLLKGKSTMPKLAQLLTTVLIGLLLVPGAVFAASPASTGAAPFQALEGAPLSRHALADAYGKALPPDNVGIQVGNSANGSETGTITNHNSMNGNTGFTTVIQNTGNNSLFQTSTVVNITLNH